jgi:hypothetical protein
VITIAQDWLRVEYTGEREAPAKIVVPLVLPPGSYRDVRLQVTPREGVRLSQRVETGDSLRETFGSGRTGSIGGSFFGSVNYTRSSSANSPQFTVSMSPDFKTAIFHLHRLKVAESTGIQIAFPIDSYTPNPSATFFAQVSLQMNGTEIEQREVPQEVHPLAARALVVEDRNAQERNRERRRFPGGPFVQFSSLVPSDTSDFLSNVAHGWDIVHVDCTVHRSKLVFTDSYPRFPDDLRYGVSSEQFFDAIDQGLVQLVVLASCNSVQVVSQFRESSADALVAATENLIIEYANKFEWEFYRALSLQKSIGESFRTAVHEATLGSRETIHTRSGYYNPMFLELKKDIVFGRQGRPPVTPDQIG